MSDDKIIRCAWASKNPIYIKYHDEEWGRPELDSVRLFEMICLGGQQCGLSWILILKKRDNYRKLFHNFNPYKISKFTDVDVKNLMTDARILRNKNKIEAIINNSRCYIKMERNKENFSDFIWSFVNKEPIINHWKDLMDIPTETPESIALSKALKKRGFKYVGSTICYSFMQTCGLVNDHTVDCFGYK